MRDLREVLCWRGKEGRKSMKKRLSGRISFCSKFQKRTLSLLTWLRNFNRTYRLKQPIINLKEGPLSYKKPAEEVVSKTNNQKLLWKNSNSVLTQSSPKSSWLNSSNLTANCKRLKTDHPVCHINSTTTTFSTCVAMCSHSKPNHLLSTTMSTTDSTMNHSKWYHIVLLLMDTSQGSLLCKR